MNAPLQVLEQLRWNAVNAFKDFNCELFNSTDMEWKHID
jgi:hypothetical protein